MSELPSSSTIAPTLKAELKPLDGGELGDGALAEDTTPMSDDACVVASCEYGGG